MSALHAAWPTLAAFHAANPTRAGSREVVFGSEWYTARERPPWRASSPVIFGRAKWQLSEQQCCVVHGVQDVAADHCFK
jgi:hypothetical protein